MIPGVRMRGDFTTRGRTRTVLEMQLLRVIKSNFECWLESRKSQRIKGKCENNLSCERCELRKQKR